VLACTGSSNVTVTVVAGSTPVAPAAGDRAVTTGGVVSGGGVDEVVNTTSTQKLLA
jgi:hypothetical protein